MRLRSWELRYRSGGWKIDWGKCLVAGYGWPRSAASGRWWVAASWVVLEAWPLAGRGKLGCAAPVSSLLRPAKVGYGRLPHALWSFGCHPHK